MGAPQNRSACRKEGFVAHRTPWEERDLRNVGTNWGFFFFFRTRYGNCQSDGDIISTATLWKRLTK